MNGSFALHQGTFFHSPLLYWNCSLSAIQDDKDLLDTVNTGFMRVSPLNMTLHWSSVFAGKLFSHHRLVAADALVISLFYSADSQIGELWDQRAADLASDAYSLGKYEIYPSHGEVKRNTFYEFFFQPMSTADYLVLMSCYTITIAYLYVQLNRAGTVKSRTGLVLAIITQLAASVMSSFTILAFLKFPVSHIPREVFPFVVMVIGVENMVRLMNAVKETPAEQSTTIRIATAVGEVGFLSTVAVITDIVILAIIGRISVPAVTEFCWFAGIALLVDFFLHFSYFLAVLSVDVRRLELQDFLDKTNLSNPDSKWDNRASSPRQTGLNRLVQGTPVSTRIAGSAIMICVLIALNMHFFDNESPWRTFQTLLENFPPRGSPEAYALPTNMPLNQARTPTSWLSLQDQLTGRELIQNLKPGGHRLIAKVYEPLFVVLKGSNRVRARKIFSDFINFKDLDALKDHSLPFILTVVASAAGVTLLMNHLLLKELPDELYGFEGEEGPLLTTQTLYEGHSLDVVMIVASPKGIVASVGLDRRIVVWNLRGKWGPTKDIISPACSEHLLWPIMGLAMDNLGQWLAIAPRSGRISFWQVKESSFYKSVALGLRGQTPSALFFAPRHEDNACGGPRLIVVRQDGWLYEVYILTGQIYHHKICDGIIVSSSHGVSTYKMSLRIVTACQQGKLFVTYRPHGEWFTEELYNPSIIGGELLSEPCTIIPLPVLGMVVSSRACNVDLVDLLSGNIVKSFQIGQFKANTLRAFHAKRRTCLHCGCPSVESFSIAYTERESGMFIMHTFVAANVRSKYICLRAERDKRENKCYGFEYIQETMHWMENVEGWEPTALNSVAGIRRIDLAQDSESSDDYNGSALREVTSLRQRRKKEKRAALSDDEDEWEAWTMSFDGVVTQYRLSELPGETLDKGLLVSRTGPVTRIGQRSIAVGFGNAIKVLLIGNERYDDDDDDDDIKAPTHRKKYHRR
ncbi:sterol-sensing domain of SREBP cleavage-activation-domain-containing protein [Kalaharituber pfeilii]|nr:sterol-sensing domain of SREBP cleavage-activation-domain-containing protein [Kalaharituber pfeilii]